MIFVTVGAQIPFDRLVNGIDEWAGKAGRSDLFAQIAGGQQPKHFEWSDFLDPDQYRQRVQDADAIVAHAGMGSILTALEFGKPILVMARQGSLGETRNDHQVATAKRLESLGRVVVATNQSHLATQLDRIDELSGTDAIAPAASGGIVDAIRDYLGEIESRRR